MAKKGKRGKDKKTKPDEKRGNLLETVSKETLGSILGIFSFVFMIFFLMSVFGKAGRVGEGAYQIFTYLFGVGFYLVPIAFLMLGISFFKSKETYQRLVQLQKSFLWI